MMDRYDSAQWKPLVALSQNVTDYSSIELQTHAYNLEVEELKYCLIEFHVGSIYIIEVTHSFCPLSICAKYIVCDPWWDLWILLYESFIFFLSARKPSLFFVRYMYLIYHNEKAIIVKYLSSVTKCTLSVYYTVSGLAWYTANYVTCIILWDISLGYFITEQNTCLWMPRECTL